MNDYKALKNIDLSGIETKRIRSTGYKADFNTACKHFYNAHPLDVVLNNDAYKGLYIALVKKSYQDGGSDYNGGYYMTFSDIGDNVYIEFLGFTGYDDIERMKEKLDSMQAFIGRAGFLSLLADTAAHGWFIKNPELLALDMIGEVELADKYRKEKVVWVAKREQEEEERREQRREEQRRMEEEKRIELDKAAQKIRSRQTTDNDNGIILELMNRYGVNVPSRTKGWILDCLVSITFNDGQISYIYRKSKNGKGSQRVFVCINELIEAIDKEAA